MSAKKPKAEEDQTTLKIPGAFRKKCDQNGVVPCKMVKDKIQEAIENGKLEVLQVWGDIGPICCRALMEALTDLNYQHLKKIRIWKADLQDEGVRSICNYIEKSNTIEYLDLMENNITELGCQFLAKAMKDPSNKIAKLRLDNNKIGLKGIKNLSEGLRQNQTIEKLSFNFCGIPRQGCKYIQQILANMNSNLRTLKLQGNPLENEGFFEVVRAVDSCGQKLQKLNLADTGLNILNFSSDDMELNDTIEQNILNSLLNVLKENKTIAKYNFKNNYISDFVAMKMLKEVKENKNIFIIDMPECIAFELKEHHAEIMKKRKAKKKPKKGKGKAKGKKK